MADDFVDLKEKIVGWAWKMFDVTASDSDKKIPRENIQLNISWDRVRFRHAEPVFTEQTKGAPTSKVLFSSKFNNVADVEQEYNFRAERTTRSICSIEIWKGVTIGADMALTFKLPMEMLETSVGFLTEMEVTKSSGEVFETEMTWSADSQIKVPPKSRSFADLVVTQRHYKANFKITTTCAGMVVVTMTNRKDNNSFVKSIEGEVAVIFRNVDGFTIAGRQVIVINHGSCEFEYAVEPHVTIRQEAITSD